MTKEENMFLFVCCEAAESKLVKLQMSRTVIIAHTVSLVRTNLFVPLLVERRLDGHDLLDGVGQKPIFQKRIFLDFNVLRFCQILQERCSDVQNDGGQFL